MTAPDESRLRAHLKALCEDIGCRYAGSDNEQAAVDYIADQFRALGLRRVRREPFRFPNWTYESAELLVGRRRPARALPCIPIVYSPNTPAEGVEGEIVYLETGTDIELARQPLEGRIGILFGGFGDEPSKLLRVQQSGLAAMLMVDWRMPFDWPLALGLPTEWHGYLSIPSAGVPYMRALDLLKRGETRARLRIEGAKTFTAESANVVAEIPGARWPEEVITICGHHDSVSAGVGANDDASGVLFTLELAALFADARPGRTLRFVTFGVEERLSAGSAHHVFRKANRVEQCVLCVNADSIAGLMGENNIFITGCGRLRALAERCARAAGYPAVVTQEISPYSDQFPFNMRGVPSVWFYRRNTPGGNWFFHSAHDNPSNVSTAVIASAVRAAAGIIERVADAPRLPYNRDIPRVQLKRIRTLAKDLYRVEI